MGEKQQCSTLTGAGRETSAGGQVKEEQVSLIRLIDRGRKGSEQAREVTFKIKCTVTNTYFPNSFQTVLMPVLNPSTLCLFKLALFHKRGAE